MKNRYRYITTDFRYALVKILLSALILLTFLLIGIFVLRLYFDINDAIYNQYNWKDFTFMFYILLLTFPINFYAGYRALLGMYFFQKYIMNVNENNINSFLKKIVRQKEKIKMDTWFSEYKEKYSCHCCNSLHK